MRIIIQNLFFLVNKNIAEARYNMQTLHSKEKQKIQIFGAEGMYLKLIAEIIAFQSIEIGLSFFLHLLSQYVNSEIWQPVTLHKTENQSKIVVY